MSAANAAPQPVHFDPGPQRWFRLASMPAASFRLMHSCLSKGAGIFLSSIKMIRPQAARIYSVFCLIDAVLSVVSNSPALPQPADPRSLAGGREFFPAVQILLAEALT
jgi:hypothetical protein